MKINKPQYLLFSFIGIIISIFFGGIILKEEIGYTMYLGDISGFISVCFLSFWIIKNRHIPIVKQISNILLLFVIILAITLGSNYLKNKIKEWWDDK